MDRPWSWGGDIATRRRTVACSKPNPQGPSVYRSRSSSDQTLSGHASRQGILASHVFSYLECRVMYDLLLTRAVWRCYHQRTWTACLNAYKNKDGAPAYLLLHERTFLISCSRIRSFLPSLSTATAAIRVWTTGSAAVQVAGAAMFRRETMYSDSLPFVTSNYRSAVEDLKWPAEFNQFGTDKLRIVHL